MYDSKTINWRTIYAGLEKVTQDITELPVVYENNKDEQPNYPFVTFNPMNDHTSLYSSTFRNDEAFYTTITFKAKAQSGAEALQISDDLRTLFQDVKYREELSEYGIVLAPNPIQDEHLNNSNNLPFMNYSEAGFDLVIEVSRHYRSNYPNINKFKLGGNRHAK